MVRRAYAQRSVFEALLPDGNELWNYELWAIDEIPLDNELVDPVDAALRRRRPLSGCRAGFGTPIPVVMRMVLLKDPRDRSFDEFDREARAALSAGASAASIASAFPALRP